METCWQDLRYALAMLKKQPGFSLVAIVTLALGIGANTAIFSLVNTALLRPMPAERPEELVTIFRGDRDRHGTSNHAYPDYLDLRRASGEVMSGLAAFTTRPANLIAGRDTQRINVGLITDNYFRVLGVAPLVGRDLLPEDNARPGTPAVALVSEGLWRRQLGAPADLAGQEVWITNHRFAVVGVVPDAAARMAVVVKVDVFVPAMMQGAIRGGRDYLDDRRSADFMVIGRLRPGIALPRAQAGFDRIVRQLQQQAPDLWTIDGRPRPITVVSERESRGIFELRGWILGFASLLMGAVGAVLLIACGNLANVLLARGLTRRQELAVRVSLGASRTRLIRLLLTESLLIAVLGGIAGFLFSVWVKDLFSVFEPQIGGPLVIDLSLDARVFAFCAGVTLLATLAFGLAPALQVTTPTLVTSLREGQHTLAGGRRVSRLRHLLLIGQVAMSVVLLVCAGLFLRGLQRMASVDLGFAPDHVALLSVDLSMQDYDPARSRAFLDEATSRLARLPGVVAADAAARAPLSLSRLRLSLRPDALDVPPDDAPAFGFNSVGPRYFEVMHIPLLAGRTFGPQDREGAPRVAIVNDVAARRFWQDQNPIGRRLYEADGSSFEIVGVARTSKYESLTETAVPFVYLPVAQQRRTALTFHVLTRDLPERPLDALRRELTSLDARLPVFDVKTMHDQLGLQLLPIRFGATLLGIFGALALALACIGLYGAMAFFVSQRTNEIGIRMALGAQRRSVLAMILQQGLRPLLWGTLIGLVPSVILSLYAAVELVAVTPADLTLLATVFLALFGIACLACLLPARRALRLDPVAALRHD